MRANLENYSRENFRVFGLLILAVLSTLIIGIILGNQIRDSQVVGKYLGFTIRLGGPLVVFFLIVWVFRGWAIRPASDNRGSIPDQEEIDLMTEDERIRLVHDIGAEIEILSNRLSYLKSASNGAAGEETLGITPVQVDEDEIR